MVGYEMPSRRAAARGVSSDGIMRFYMEFSLNLYEPGLRGSPAGTTSAAPSADILRRNHHDARYPPAALHGVRPCDCARRPEGNVSLPRMRRPVRSRVPGVECERRDCGQAQPPESQCAALA